MLETRKSPELRKGFKSCLRLSFRREEARSKEGAECKTCEPGSGWMERMLQREHRQRGAGKAGRALGSSLLPGQLGREMRATASKG